VEQRIGFLNNMPVNHRGRCVVYWMDQAQRADDNYALAYAIKEANRLLKPLLCYFAIEDSYPFSSRRIFTFILAGIKETAAELERRQIPFVARIECADDGVPRIERELDPCLIVTEQAKDRRGQSRREKIASRLSVMFTAIDSETVIPRSIWQEEVAQGRDMRKRIPTLWKKYLVEVPHEKPQVSGQRLRIPRRMELEDKEVEVLAASLRADTNVLPSPTLAGGVKAAKAKLNNFLRKHLVDYTRQSQLGNTSNLGPYLQFGQIWAGRVALEAQNSEVSAAIKKAFLENLIIARETAFAFCARQDGCDSCAVMAPWAKATLEAHANDPRPYRYGREQFEAALTHDLLWNATQQELVLTGRIEPGLRSYWAKQMLAWSPAYSEAWATAVYLNDKYALDGRSAGGYYNIAHCLGGVDDEPLPKELPVFGCLQQVSAPDIMGNKYYQSYLAKIRQCCRAAGVKEV
jgi:deoxyribodipyrimidine photo-lyase